MKRLFNGIALALAIFMIMIYTPMVSAEGAAIVLPQLDDCFTERDLSGEWDASAVEILLTGDSAETRSHTVSIDEGTITIQDGGAYQLSGTLTDGSIVIDAEDDERVQLILNGVDITCADGPAIYVLQSDKVFITLAEGTENTLANGGAFTNEGIEAVIYADEDLTFNGTGTLIIDSPAGDGIDGKDDIKFTSGTYVINATGRGIDANDSVRIADGSFTITTDGDAIRSRHETKEDLGYVYIWGGTFAITTGGGAANAAPQSMDAAFPAEMPEAPDFNNEAGEMPEPTGFSGEPGEIPEPPEFNGEAGELPAPMGFDGEIAGTPSAMPEGTGTLPANEATEDEDAVSAKAIKASGDTVILGGTFTFDSADDTLHSDRDLILFDGSLTISSGDDAMHADSDIVILGGTIEITQSCEGIEAEVIDIRGGSIAVCASDDGLNAASSTGSGETFDAQEGVLIDISSGSLRVNAEGDGIDSNGDIVITGGEIVVSGSQNMMNGAFDYNGTACISGGTVIAAGASGLAVNFSADSTQAAFLIDMDSEAGEIVLTDSEGNNLLSGSVEKSFGSVVISCPALTVGETYTVTCGDNQVEIVLTDTITGEGTGGMAFPGNGQPAGPAGEANAE